MERGPWSGEKVARLVVPGAMVLVLALAFTAAGGKHSTVEVWVNNQEANSVQVFDETLNLVAEIPSSGDKPHMASFTSSGRYFYSANVGVSGPGNNVDKIDTRTKQIVQTFSIPSGDTGSIHATVVRPGSQEVWLDNVADKFYVLDRHPAPENIVATVDTTAGSKPVCMGFTANGKKMYVSSTVAGTFDLVDPNTRTNLGTIANGDVGGRPCGLALNHNGRRMLATVGSIGGDHSADKIGYIDVASDTFIDMTSAIPAGTLADPHAIVDTPNGSKILVGNRAGEEILVLDGYTFELLDTIPLGHPVDLIDLHPNGKFAYAALRHHGVAKIEIESGNIVEIVNAGGDPHGLLAKPASN